MLKILVASLAAVFFVSAAVFLLKSMYHFYHMNIEVKSRKHGLLSNLVPLFALTKTPYTEQGKEHLEKFSKNFLIFSAHAALIALVSIILEIQ